MKIIEGEKTEIWSRYLGKLLDLETVQKQLKAPSPETITEMVQQQRLLALPTEDGALVYPAFQFTPVRKRPYKVLPQILETFEGVIIIPYTVACWFISTQQELAGQTPSAWLQSGRNHRRVLLAAEHAATHLRQ